MSGAYLAWGLDLGPVNSTAAILFDNPAWHPIAKSWDIFGYGSVESGSRDALLLLRSLAVVDEDTEDFSVNDFVMVTLGTSGMPEMASAPTSEEIEELKEIVKAVRPDPSVAELPLQLLLLPLA